MFRTVDSGNNLSLKYTANKKFDYNPQTLTEIRVVFALEAPELCTKVSRKSLFVVDVNDAGIESPV